MIDTYILIMYYRHIIKETEKKKKKEGKKKTEKKYVFFCKEFWMDYVMHYGASELSYYLSII